VRERTSVCVCSPARARPPLQHWCGVLGVPSVSQVAGELDSCGPWIDVLFRRRRRSISSRARANFPVFCRGAHLVLVGLDPTPVCPELHRSLVVRVFRSEASRDRVRMGLGVVSGAALGGSRRDEESPIGTGTGALPFGGRCDSKKISVHCLTLTHVHCPTHRPSRSSVILSCSHLPNFPMPPRPLSPPRFPMPPRPLRPCFLVPLRSRFPVPLSPHFPVPLPPR
jgi:hypothetical protein